MQRHIGRGFYALNIHETTDVAACQVGTKLHPLADPVGAFTGNGFLRQLVAELDLKLRAVERTLTAETGYIGNL